MKKNEKQKHNFFDNTNLLFVIFILISYLVVAPFLLVNEYKHNDTFKEWLLCEETQQKELIIYSDGNITEKTNSCEEIKNISDKANIFILLTMLFWLGVIIEKDIYPNRKKINKWLKDHYKDY